MTRVSRRMVSAVTALSMVLVWVPAGWAARTETSESGRYPGFLEMAGGTLTGQVLYPDSTTPVAGAAVRVWSVEKEKFVQETKTDREGRYETKEIGPGAYTVVVADRVAVDLRVTGTGSAGRRLDVVVPRGKPFFAIEPGSEGPAPKRMSAVGGGGGMLKTVLIIGGGVATAVGVTAALGGFGGKSHHRTVVSP